MDRVALLGGDRCRYLRSARFPVLTAVTVLLAVVLAACSSGDDPPRGSSSTPAAAPTREEFIVAADEICGRVENEAAGPRQELTSGAGPTPEKTLSLVPRIATPTRSGIADLRLLTPPPADEAAVAALLSEMENANARLEEAAAAAARADGAALDAAVSEWSERTSMIQETQREFGFKVCGAGRARSDAELSEDQRRFVAEGDALCRAADEAAEPQLSLVFGGDPAQAAGALAIVLSVFTDLVDDLARLTPPAGDEATIASILDGQRRGLAVLAEAQRLSAVGQVEPFRQKLAELDTAFGPSDDALRRYGFKDCGAAPGQVGAG